MSLWFNNLRPNEKSVCYLSPIKALPLVSVKLKNPAVVIGGKRIVFPVEMESGSYLEFHRPDRLQALRPQGRTDPRGHAHAVMSRHLRPGANNVIFTCDHPTGPNPRAKVTIITHGEPL